MVPSAPPAALQLGFLTVLAEANGYVGGYLVTTSWGRPLEFRLTSAVQPGRVHQVLYGDTLTTYLHADLIGKTLLDKTTTTAHLVFTDREPVLELRARFDVPVLWVTPPGDAEAEKRAAAGQALRPARPPRHGPVLAHPRFAAEDAVRLAAILDKIDAGLDLAEPFQRVRDAIAEARGPGGASRVA
jgi:hypothetical protein